MNTLGARWRYHWNNSADPVSRLAHRVVDTRRWPGAAAVSTSPHGGPSLAYAGLAQGHLNVLRLLEVHRDRNHAPDRALRHVATSWTDLRRGRFPDADIVLVGAEGSTARALPGAGALVAPFRVHLVVDTDGGIDAVRARISKRERWEFTRNSRASDLELKEHDSTGALNYFYHRMHLPTMRARHRDNSRTEPYTVARDVILRRGKLFLLHQDGTAVAGVLCRYVGETLTTRLLGVLDGGDAHYESGAFKAVYHLLLEWACAHGVLHVDFFGTEAFVGKGIFQWKRKFSPRVVLPPNHFHTKRLYLAPRRDTPAVRDFLVANPLLRCGPDGQLVPVYFQDRQRPARTDISAKSRNAPEPQVLDLDEFLGAADPGRATAR